MYSQKDKRWGNTTIGLSGITFEKAGCLLCSIATLDGILHGGIGRTPLEIMNIFLVAGSILKDGRLNMQSASRALNMKYEYLTKKPQGICIAETDFYKKLGVPQHFFILDPHNSKIIDPLDTPEVINWKTKPAPYNIVSFRRLFYG
jgi:hypothetical protein